MLAGPVMFTATEIENRFKTVTEKSRLSNNRAPDCQLSTYSYNSAIARRTVFPVSFYFFILGGILVPVKSLWAFPLSH